jgi:hypothetical protein
MITVPSVGPLDGGAPPGRFRITTTPGNLTYCNGAPCMLAAVPPMPTKIFLLASMSAELRCKCPMVTPASFGGMVCATAAPAARFDASHNAVMNAFTRPSLNVRR